MSSIQLDERGLIVDCPHCGQPNRLAYERLDQRPRCAKCATPLPAVGEPVTIKDDTTFTALTSRSRLPVLVDFWAAWCGPCKMVAPDVAKVAAEGAGQWLVAKLNTEDQPGLAQRFRVSSIPLFVVFKSGHEVARKAGALPAASLRQFIEKYC